MNLDVYYINLDAYYMNLDVYYTNFRTNTGNEKKRKEERRESRYFCGFLAFGSMKRNVR
jgi:hypothetical protein